MVFQLNPYVNEQNHFRCHTTEHRYMAQLDERGLLLHIDNMLVDAEQLVLRSFQCDSGYCTKCQNKDGLTHYKGCCCTDLEVDVTPEEVRRLRELGAMARDKMKLAPNDPLNPVLDRLSKDTFTEITDKGELAFKHLRSGRCALSWVGPGGAVRCSINSMCLALEVPLTVYKPDPCYLFPLHYVEPIPGTYFITLLSKETYAAIGADAYVGKLRCLAKPQPGSPPAYQFLKSELDHCFSGGLYDALHAAAQPLLRQHGLLHDAGHGTGEEAQEPPAERPTMGVAAG